MRNRAFLLMIGLIVLMSTGAFAQSDTIILEQWHIIRQGIVGVFNPYGGFNPGRYKWTVLTPSQSPIPELSDYVDPNQIHPFPTWPGHSESRDLSTLTFNSCDDSDRCEFFFPQSESENPEAAQRLVVRLKGIHSPHINASCDQESSLGSQAKDFLESQLSSAHDIQLKQYFQNGREVKGRLVADGQDLSDLLVSQGLAVENEGTKKDWCS